MDVDFLRTGRVLSLTEPADKQGRALALQMRRVPLLTWAQIGQVVGNGKQAATVDPQTLLETELPGDRTFALRVRDDSMNPMFGEGEIIFVDPDSPAEVNHYVVAGDEAVPEAALLRELREIGGRPVLHPLNRRYPDLPLATGQRIWGRVVRLRKNL
jgi:SOS-response transcriptional repressor LexA